MMATVYGHEVEPKNDHFVSIAEEAGAMVTNLILPGTAVNAFPFLRHLPAWFPGAGFKRYVLKTRMLTAEMQDAPLKFVKRTMARIELIGTASHI